MYFDRAIRRSPRNALHTIATRDVRRMKGRAVVASGIAFVVLILFIWAVGWTEVLAAVSRASLAIYSVAFVGCLVMLFCRSIVWHYLLGTVDTRRPYWLVSGVFLTAMFAKYVTPYGQVASGVGVAAVVSRYYESTYEESLAAIWSADFLNYLPYYTFGSLGLAYLLFVDTIPISPGPYVPRVLVIGGLFVLIVTILWRVRTTLSRRCLRVGSWIRDQIAAISPRLGRQLSRDRLEPRFRGFFTTLGLLSRNQSTILLAMLWAHVAWLGLAAALYLSAVSVGAPIPVGIAFISVALSKLGFIFPTPGGVGGVEIALASVLYLVAPMGVATATAVAILYRFATYWFTVLLGGLTSIALASYDPTPP